MPKAKYKPKKNIKSIDQKSIAQIVAARLGMTLSSVMEVIELEQKITMQQVRNGFKVVKKNYVTFTPIEKPAYKLNSKLDGKIYKVPLRTLVRPKIGQGFKIFVANNGSKMPENMCRFVDISKNESTNQSNVD